MEQLTTNNYGLIGKEKGIENKISANAHGTKAV
jgi:hypothetical protein